MMRFFAVKVKSDTLNLVGTLYIRAESAEAGIKEAVKKLNNLPHINRFMWELSDISQISSGTYRHRQYLSFKQTLKPLIKKS